MIGKVIDDADHIVEVALTGFFLDVTGERQLPPSPTCHSVVRRLMPSSMRTIDQRRNGNRFPPSSDSGDIGTSLAARRP